MAAQIQLWQGQFPPPEAVERFEKVQPGAFNRMIAMAEFAQTTQAADTKRAHEFAQADTRRGQFLGAATTGLAMVCSLACVTLAIWKSAPGAYVAAAAFVSVPVMAVAQRLVESSRKPPAQAILEAVSNNPFPQAQATPPAQQS